MKAEVSLPSTAETVIWGWIAADRAPVLSVQSGDTVRIDTVSVGRGFFAGDDGVSTVYTASTVTLTSGKFVCRLTIRSMR